MDPRGKGMDERGSEMGASSGDEIDTSRLLRGIARQKVLFATFKLAGEVERWWHAMKLLEEQQAVPIAMTWGRFKQVLYNQNFPATTKNAKTEEFFSLTQGRLTVQQYAAKFLELSYFAPFVDFTELVEKATIAELSLQRGTEASERRKRVAYPQSQTNVREGSWRGDSDATGQESERNDRGRQGDSSRLHCHRCNQRHWGECRSRSVICYRCSKQGHIAQECREPPNNAPALN
ncbi:uncharacterized protein LOC131166570 [Malania oleifera]|uniref:uncharacterized protein LOC131166570 n=1 Tax=Malania oleifera TaxID=397392 RepID=UPI0025AEB75B|nr:uncharacterized protein LOC131166570 [Malania oleifera]